MTIPSPLPNKRGKLKIFLGMSPGVGKTYTMLSKAHAKRHEGSDIVAGIIETHSRPETEALLKEMEIIPLQTIEYRGISFQEFDLDAMLERKPQIALIDELAHSNIVGARHTKRYLDVKELLEQGIDVYTTLNVQHIESRADSVENITGIRIAERIPDEVISWADEIEIIDISPHSLRKRIAQGNVYMGDKTATAADSFFTSKNLVALRELALRVTAEHVNHELIEILKHSRSQIPTPSGERIMVAVGPSPFSEKLLRWTKRYADALSASWVAVHIDTGILPTPETAQRISTNMELARSMGAELISYSGEDITESLLTLARRESATQIVVGRSQGSALTRFLNGGSPVHKLIAQSGNIAVHVLPSETGSNKVRWQRIYNSHKTAPKQYLIAIVAALFLTLFCSIFEAWMGYWSATILFLSITVIGGLLLNRGPVLLLALLSCLCWNFFLTPPLFSLRIKSEQDIFMFFILLFIAIAMGQLTSRMNHLKDSYRRREVRAFSLYKFLNCLNGKSNFNDMLNEALSHIKSVSNFNIRLFIAKDVNLSSPLYPIGEDSSSNEQGVAEWTITNDTVAGRGTGTLNDINSIFFPVRSSKKVWGALAITTDGAHIPAALKDLILQMITLLATSIEREVLKSNDQRQRDLETSQKLQKTLLDTVSHELKTPLSVILSALEQSKQLIHKNNTETAIQLLDSAEQSSNRLLRNVNMLLDLTRFERHIITAKNETIDIPDLADRLSEEILHDYPLKQLQFNIQPDCELIRSDETLLFQLINQLCRNSFEHAETDSPVTVDISTKREMLHITVSDQGKGIPAQHRKQLFDSFFQGDNRGKGLGLGLSIAKRICDCLGGSLELSDNQPSGCIFTAQLPQHSNPL